MTQYAKLLYIHISKIELLEAEFDKAAPTLLKLSRKEGNTKTFRRFLTV